MKRWMRITGTAFLVTSVLPYVYVEYRLHAHNWAPLQVPAKLEPNSESVGPGFVTDLTGTYQVSLAFAPLDAEAQQCLLGNVTTEFCKSGVQSLDLYWGVLREDADREMVVTEYQPYRPVRFEGPDLEETVLGTFDAQRGSVYKVAIQVRNIAPELRSASAKLRVEASGIYWENWVAMVPLTLVFAAVFAPIGMVILGWGYFSDQRRARAS